MRELALFVRLVLVVLKRANTEGINLAIPVHSNMEKPEQYGKMLNVSFLAIGLVYVCFALIAYSFFLSDIQPIVIQNLTGESPRLRLENVV